MRGDQVLKSGRRSASPTVNQGCRLCVSGYPGRLHAPITAGVAAGKGSRLMRGIDECRRFIAKFDIRTRWPVHDQRLMTSTVVFREECRRARQVDELRLIVAHFLEQ